MNAEFWSGRRVFLTGHTGFKGGWLSLWLQSLGAEVYGYALEAPTNPSIFESCRVAEGMSSVIDDIRDLKSLAATLHAADPEVIIHMAAQPLVRYSYEQPLETYETNVMGTANLLEGIRSCKNVRAVVIVTTDKCYENLEWHWGYRESDRLGGYDPYSNSKACTEMVAAAYRNSFFNPAKFAEHGVAVATARAGNVIGGGDWAVDRLIPDAARAVLAGQPVMIRNPHAVRPWQHVLEPLHGYLMLAERLWEEGVKYGEGWNFGPADEDARPVGWVVDRFVTSWGDEASWEQVEGEHAHEARLLKLDCSKAQAELGWKPCLRIEEGIAWTLEWYRSFASEEDMRALTENQIARFKDLSC